MKTNCWLILTTMIATSVIAQDTNTLPPIPAPVTTPTATESTPVAETNAPPAKPAKHIRHVAPRKAIVEPTVTLTPGPAEVTGSSVNARGQAGLKGEVIAHLAKGETVNVLEQINLAKHRADEPAQWAKISFPTNEPVWVMAKYIDKTNQTVLPKKLNLRAGPGENYSVVGVVERGASVNEITTKGHWMKIEPPTSAYAFVAAMYLKEEAPSAPESAVATTETETTTPTPVPPAPTPTPVPEAQPIQTNPPETAEINLPSAETNLPPRTVSHEGVVGQVGSPIAPTAYVLYDPSTYQNIDFIYSSDPTLDLSRYKGFRIIVTGEEGLAKRWKNTPVLNIQSIIVLSTNAVPVHRAASPHGAERH